MVVYSVGIRRPKWLPKFGSSGSEVKIKRNSITPEIDTSTSVKDFADGDHMTPRKEAAEQAESEEVVEREVPYAPFSTAPTVVHPSEYHQAATFFVCHPKVPVRWKMFYLSISGGIVLLQIVSLLAMIGDIDNVDYDTLLSPTGVFGETNYLDYYMVVLVAFLTAFCVNGEWSQAHLTELMLRKAVANEGGLDALGSEEASWSATKWGLAVLVIQKIRVQVFIPLTVLTAPILAIGSGDDVNALNIALNVMAILFVFDFDDGVYNTLLNQQQREYLEETVNIELSESDHREMTLLRLLVVLAVPAASILPVILYDPRWQIAGGADPMDLLAVAPLAQPDGTSPFVWSFCPSAQEGCGDLYNPTQALVFISCLLCFGVAFQIALFYEAVNARFWSSRRKLVYYILSWTLSSLFFVYGVYTAWAVPQWVNTDESSSTPAAPPAAAPSTPAAAPMAAPSNLPPAPSSG